MHFQDLPSLIMPEKRKLFTFPILKPTMLLNLNAPDMMKLLTNVQENFMELVFCKLGSFENSLTFTGLNIFCTVFNNR